VKSVQSSNKKGWGISKCKKNGGKKTKNAAKRYQPEHCSLMPIITAEDSSSCHPGRHVVKFENIKYQKWSKDTAPKCAYMPTKIIIYYMVRDLCE